MIDNSNIACTIQELAVIAYTEHCDMTGLVDNMGQPLVSFDKLTIDQQNIWTNICYEIVSCVMLHPIKIRQSQLTYRKRIVKASTQFTTKY